MHRPRIANPVLGLIIKTLVFPAALAGGHVHASDVLPAPIAAALERHGLSGSGLSIYVADLDTGTEILSYRAQTPRNPASTMKIVTALAALEILTPAYRWKTRIYAESVPLDGAIGDTFFIGGGDPYLVQERMWLLVRELRAQGIDAIDGDLIVDATYFAPMPENPAAFDGEPHRIYNVVPYAALANFNSIRFHFEPGDAPGQVLVTPDPALDYLRIENRLRMRERRCGGYRRGISMGVGPAGRVRFEGRFPSACQHYSLSRSVLPRRRYTGELFRTLWREAGGTWDGEVRDGVLDTAAEQILEFDSISLGEAVRLMNKHSSNLIARHLLLTLGAEVEGAPATEGKGIAAVGEWLQMRELNFPEFVIENGAGRSRRARISAENLVRVIKTGWRSRYMPEFLSSLALIGQDGTLSERHEGSALAGRAHLKTGRLDDVVGIAGVMQNPDGRRYGLAILHNAPRVHRGIGAAVQDSILEWISSHTPVAE